MAYTEMREIKPQGFFQKLGNSFKGVVSGFVLVVAATGLLWWNEGRAVHSGDAIAEAQLVCEELADLNSIDSSFDGKVVHAFGQATSQGMLTDGVFGISVNNALKLRRTVEYYQWVEQTKTEKVKDGDKTYEKTTYTYEKKWVKEPVSSGTFKEESMHQNTILVTIEDKNQVADNVEFGAYKLPKFLVDSINQTSKVDTDVTEEDIKRIHNELFGDLQTNLTNYAFGHSDLQLFNRVQKRNSGFYLGRKESDPQIGDVRITFTQVAPTDVSIIAQVQGNTFTHFTASNGISFHRLAIGNVSKEQMFADAESENNIMTWILRVVGIFLVIAGIRAILGPISTITSWIPVIGSIVGAGVSFISFAIGIAWSFIVIAIAWIRFRPILGITLLVIALAFVIFTILKGHKNKAVQPASETTNP